MKQLILDFLKDEGGWINLALMGAGALASFLSGRKKNQQQGIVDETSTSTPNLDPEVKNARSTVLDQYLQRLNGNQGYMTGYAGSGMRNINRGAQLNRTALDNILAARGLSGSIAGAGLAARAEDERMKQLIDFQSTLPLVSRQLQSEDLSGLSSVIAQSPYGTTTTRKGTNTTTSNSGGTAAGLEQGIASGTSIAAMLNKYYPQGW